MVSAANQDAYGNPGWGPAAGPWNQAGGPWGSREAGPGWSQPPSWRPMWLSGPMGIVLMVLGFIFFWPVGLAILLFLLGSGRMGCGGRRRRDAYQAGNWGNSGGWGGWKAWACGNGGNRAAPSSGNRAFDEYRTETLRRLEDEQKEFGAFLDRLRFARDKAEFDQFMAERRGRPTPPTNGNGDQDAA